MRTQFRHSAASQNRLKVIIEKSDPDPPGKFPLFLLLLICITSYVIFSPKPFIEIDIQGKPQLAEWRKNKLDNELKNLDEAEQYVLRVKKPGLYPCFSCTNASTIFLKQFEVWKYGYTTKGQKGRYQKSLNSKNLLYFVQYEGSITDCMKEEKMKIYNYALLPENLTRENPLIRPPGNKQDN